MAFEEDGAGDAGTSREGKKKLIDAVEDIAQSGKTSHRFLQDVNLARIINLQSGGAVIAPWDVQHLSDDELEAFRALGVELPTRQREAAMKEENFEDARRRHPNYRRYSVQ